MTIAVSWFDTDKTIIRYDFPEAWTWEDFYETVHKSVALEKTVNHPVYIISINPPNTRIPLGNALHHFHKGFSMHPSNMRFVATLNNNIMTITFVRTLIKLGIVSSKIRIVKSVEEALQLIEEDKAKQVEN